MVFCNHQFLFIGIRTKFNDLHPVQQRSGNRVQRICRGNKHHIGQIKGNLQIVVPVGVILLRIQNLQQGGTGISAVVRTHFINFVQQQHRIGTSCLGHGRHNSAGHGTHIGFAMAPDVRFIMDAAQRNPSHFPVQTSGNRIGNAGLADTGRTYQAQNLGWHFRCHLPNGDGFQDSLLDLFQAKMVVFQNLFCRSNIHPLFGLLVPGKIQHRIQIVAKNGPLGRSEGLLLQTIHIFQQLLFQFLTQMQIFNTLDVVFKFRRLVCFPQLILKNLDLLTDIVIPLVLIQCRAGLLLNIRFQAEHLHLLAEQTESRFQPFHRVQLAQHFGLVRKVNSRILGNGIRNEACIFTSHHPKLNCLGRMLRHLQIQSIQGYGLPAQSMGTDIIGGLCRRNRLYQALQIRLALLQLCDLSAAYAGNQNAQILPLGLQHLLDLGHRSDGVQIFQFGVIHQQIFLGNQKQGLVCLHRRFQSTHGFLTAHIKMDRLLRENGQPAKSQNRHFSCVNRFCQGNVPPFAKKGVVALPPFQFIVCQRVFLWGVQHPAQWWGSRPPPLPV